MVGRPPDHLGHRHICGVTHADSGSDKQVQSTGAKQSERPLEIADQFSRQIGSGHLLATARILARPKR